MASPITLRTLIGRMLSNALIQLDGSESQNVRGGKYQELYSNVALGANMATLADEGSYFTIGNATPGTGLATIAAPTAFAAVSPFAILQNMEPVGGRSLYLDYMRLTCTAPGTGGTALHMTTVTEPSSVGRYTSGATGIVGASGATGLTLANAKTLQSAPSTVAAYVGPLVASAATPNARQISADLVLRSQIPVLNDQYIVKFGGIEGLVGNSISQTTAGVIVIPHAPVVLDPQSSFLSHLWLPAQSAASSFQIEFGAFLR